MLPVFVGLVVWVLLLAIIALVIMLSSRRLRPFSGFIFLPPVFGIGGAFIGFLAVGWFFDRRLRPELAASLAFYLVFLLCGGTSSALGLVGGLLVWRRFRTRPA